MSIKGAAQQLALRTLSMFHIFEEADKIVGAIQVTWNFISSQLVTHISETWKIEQEWQDDEHFCVFRKNLNTSPCTLKGPGISEYNDRSGLLNFVVRVFDEWHYITPFDQLDTRYCFSQEKPWLSLQLQLISWRTGNPWKFTKHFSASLRDTFHELFRLEYIHPATHSKERRQRH